MQSFGNSPIEPQSLVVALVVVATASLRAQDKVTFHAMSGPARVGAAPCLDDQAHALQFIGHVGKWFLQTDHQYSGLAKGHCRTTLYKCDPSHGVKHGYESDISDPESS